MIYFHLSIFRLIYYLKIKDHRPIALQKDWWPKLIHTIHSQKAWQSQIFIRLFFFFFTMSQWHSSLWHPQLHIWTNYMQNKRLAWAAFCKPVAVSTDWRWQRCSETQNLSPLSLPLPPATSQALRSATAAADVLTGSRKWQKYRDWMTQSWEY